MLRKLCLLEFGRLDDLRRIEDRPRTEAHAHFFVFQGWMTTRTIIRIATNKSNMAIMTHLLAALWLLLAFCSCWVPEATWSTAFPTCFLPSPIYSIYQHPQHTMCCTTRSSCYMVKSTYICKGYTPVSQYCQVALLVPQPVLPYLEKSAPQRLTTASIQNQRLILDSQN